VPPDEPRWVPLSKRRDVAAMDRHRTLYEGVPPWLKHSLWDWVAAQLRYFSDAFTETWNREALKRIERKLQIELAWSATLSSGADVAAHSLESRVKSDDIVFLDLIDLLVSEIAVPPRSQRLPSEAAELDSLLLEGGSLWRVGRHGRKLGLERRVDETVTSATREAITTPGTAGDHLSKAWKEAYGRSPDPSAAYAEAVKAVEAAAKPVVTPNDDKATLGKMVPALRDRPDKRDAVLAAEPAFDKVAVVSVMAEFLWQGHTDRHGTPDRVPVTQEQAEAAVHLAALLVQWFTAGSIWRRAN
jgi:hypothetical protein